MTSCWPASSRRPTETRWRCSSSAAFSVARGLPGGFALPDSPQLPERIEDQYVDRLSGLPLDTQRLVLLAAADPGGDAALLLRAARLLGLDMGTAELAADQPAEIRPTVRFGTPSCVLPRTGGPRSKTAEPHTVRWPRQPTRRPTPTGGRGTSRMPPRVSTKGWLRS